MPVRYKQFYQKEETHTYAHASNHQYIQRLKLGLQIGRDKVILSSARLFSGNVQNSLE
jgi:hypothetical protein